MFCDDKQHLAATKQIILFGRVFLSCPDLFTELTFHDIGSSRLTFFVAKSENGCSNLAIQVLEANI
eukprot:2700336-Prorocentrum_lima.AAC.1